MTGTLPISRAHRLTYDMVMNNYHNGSIILLHAVSQSNTEALDQILKDLKAKGYVFQTLDQLPPATSIGQ